VSREKTIGSHELRSRVPRDFSRRVIFCVYTYICVRADPIFTLEESSRISSNYDIQKAITFSIGLKNKNPFFKWRKKSKWRNVTRACPRSTVEITWLLRIKMNTKCSRIAIFLNSEFHPSAYNILVYSLYSVFLAYNGLFGKNQ